MSQKINRLSKMKLDFVSLVPAGDNPPARVVISKAAPDTNDRGGQMGPNDLISKDDLDPEVVQYIEGLEQDNEDLTKAAEDHETEKAAWESEKATLTKSLADAEASGNVVKSAEEQHAALLEKADPAVRALIAKQQADMEEVRKAAETERNLRLDREFIAKAEGMPMLNTDKTALGGLLRRISEALTAEDAAEVEKVLKAANAQVAQGNVFQEFGAPGGETVVSKSVDAAAQEIIKAHPEWTMDQARAAAYDQNPALLAQAMTEGN